MRTGSWTVSLALASIMLLAATGCGGGSSATGQRIACKEVEASSAKTEAVATAVKATFASEHHRTVPPLEAIVEQVNDACSGLKPEDHPFKRVLSGLKVHAQVEAIAETQSKREHSPEAITKRTTCAEIERDSAKATRVAELVVAEIQRYGHGPLTVPEAEEALKEQCPTGVVEIEPFKEALAHVGVTHGLAVQKAESLAAE